MSSQAGSVIQVGSRVSGFVGALGYWNGDPQVDATGKKKKHGRFRRRLGFLEDIFCLRVALPDWNGRLQESLCTSDNFVLNDLDEQPEHTSDNFVLNYLDGEQPEHTSDNFVLNSFESTD